MPRALDPAYVRTQIATLRAIQPDLWHEGDEILLADMLEAETDLHAFLDALVSRIGDVEEHLPGLEKRISDHRARKERYEGQIAMLRALALKLMDAAGVRKVELDQATLSINTGPRKVIITNFASLPEDCIRVKREPDKITIKERIESGATIPGAEMSNAEDVLKVSK